MSKTSKRLLLSFLLSVACAGATHYWFISGAGVTSNYGDQTPIARLSDHKNEVHRRPLKRLIWQNLSQNDSLFGGEQIRTQANSSAVIEIIEGGTIIELEPGSLITLEKNDGKLSLDFLQGNLFLKGGGEGGDLSLKTGGKEIQVGEAELSLGKTADGKVDLQVFKGSVDGAESKPDPFEIVSPQPLAEVYVFPDLRKSISWEWKKDLGGPDKVKLLVGKTRTELEPVTDLQFGPKKILGALPPGEYFWQLVATGAGTETVSSKVYRIKVLPIRPPVAVFPERNAQIALLDTKPDIDVRWVNPGKLENLILEIAESKDLKKAYRSIPVKTADSHVLAAIKKGTYFWRVTGYLQKSKEPVSSEIMNFNVAIEKAFTGPELLLPTDKAKFQGDEKKPISVLLSWKPVPGAVQYRLKVNETGTSKSREYVTTSTEFSLEKAEAGTYEWSVVAVDNKQLRSPDSGVRSFAVSKLPKIEWKDAQDVQTYFYFTPNPELFAEWNNSPAPAAKYKIFYRPKGAEAAEAKELLVGGISHRLPVSSEGSWILQVEAINPEGKPVARSSEKSFEVKVAPLLAAPLFPGEPGASFKADRKGSLNVRWEKVPEALNYEVQLLGPGGNPIKTQAVEKSELNFEKMKPGKYKVKVHAIDKAKRRGIASETREVLVPDSSDVRAPKMMKIEVK